MKLSTDKILNKTLQVIQKRFPELSENYLDIGSGTGELISLVTEKFPAKAYATDYTNKLINISKQQVDVSNLNDCKLPYCDNYFEVVTITEVIEHLENYHCVLKEIYRVLKPGGLVVVSTPNILNLKSRFRFLFNGFYNLFGPLPANPKDIHSANGHITPISQYYLLHSLAKSGYIEAQTSIDKPQKTSTLILLFILPFIITGSIIFKRREKHKYHTINKDNEKHIDSINTFETLRGRTIIVSAKKPI